MSNQPGTIIPFSSYRAAADRIRRGQEQEMDDAVCEGYHAPCVTCGESSANSGSRDCPSCGVRVQFRSVMDLPIAKRMFEADRRDGAK